MIILFEQFSSVSSFLCCLLSSSHLVDGPLHAPNNLWWVLHTWAPSHLKTAGTHTRTYNPTVLDPEGCRWWQPSAGKLLGLSPGYITNWEKAKTTSGIISMACCSLIGPENSRVKHEEHADVGKTERINQCSCLI